MSLELTRRELLIALAGLTLGLAVYAEKANHWLRLGEAFLKKYPDENNAVRLQTQISNEKIPLAQRVSDDFKNGRVVEVEGWFLALTEARAAALAVLRG